LRIPIINQERRVGWERAKSQRNRNRLKQRKVEGLFDQPAGQHLWQTVVLMAGAVTRWRWLGSRRSTASQQMEDNVQGMSEGGEVRGTKRFIVVSEQPIVVCLR
jgi:hypothetical protein